MRTFACLALIALVVLPASSGSMQAKAEPEHITVQHILIAFKGSLPDPKVTRSQADAETLALKIYERAKAGEDFDAMVKTYTNDAYPGIYKMSNRDVAPGPGEFSRSRMVKAFGDIGFSLEVGGVGLAVYDPAASKYGWHIIKRLE